MTSSQYDPLGIAAPVTIGMRVKMKELYRLNIDWDTPLDGCIRSWWLDRFRLLVIAGGIQFHRSTKPEGAIGKCILVGYFDGSDQAYAAVIYSRWDMADGSVHVNLVASKSKVGPMYGTSTPRLGYAADCGCLIG